MARTIKLATLLTVARAQHQQAFRKRIAALLTPPPAGGAGQNAELQQIANTLTRYAQTQATVYDTSPSGTPAAAGASLLQRQVERAMTQVLGRGAGRGASSFMTALNGAFPIGSDGQVLFTPARSAVALATPADAYTGPGANPNAVARITAGLAGQLSAEQATLYREATVVATDALNVLAGLQPFVPEAETDKVEALRAIVKAEINTLVEEFGRVEEPRDDRVNSYLAALTGPHDGIAEFGRHAGLDRSIPATTPDDEAMIAGFDLVKNYIDLLSTIWNSYLGQGRSLQFPEFTLRLQRGSVLLSVIADGTNNFMLAMDSVGFTERERRSQATKFSTIDPRAPDITVGDLTDELDRLSTTDGPAYLADSGHYGLRLLADQSHRLNILIARILAAAKRNTAPIVAQVLTHERVNWAINDVYRQLDALADLAA